MTTVSQVVKRNNLTPDEYTHLCGSYVKLTRLQHVFNERINLNGYKVRAIEAYKYNFEKGRRTFTNPTDLESSSYTEIAIDEKVLRINLKTNCLNLKVTNDLFTPRKNKNALMLSNDELNKSIIKSKENGRQSPISTPNKSVSFNNTFYITPISPRRRAITPPQQQNSYENTFKEYLKKMNGSSSTPEQKTDKVQDPAAVVAAATTTTVVDAAAVAAAPTPDEPTDQQHNNDAASNNTRGDDDDDDDEEAMEVEVLEDEPPRRGRGRPRGSGRLKQYTAPRPPPIPRDPNSPPKRRGWPLGLPRKKFVTYKNVHTPYGGAVPQVPAKRGPGRPRKILAFSFQTIVTDIKAVNLPSELWSAHVSVTSKRAQVCFTRVVQNKANNIPVECDRSVKFNGSVKYLVRINNRDVGLVAAPPVVNSIKDIEILLNIVNDIAQNDPVLEYFNR